MSLLCGCDATPSPPDPHREGLHVCSLCLTLIVFLSHTSLANLQCWQHWTLSLTTSVTLVCPSTPCA